MNKKGATGGSAFMMMLLAIIAGGLVLAFLTGNLKIPGFGSVSVPGQTAESLDLSCPDAKTTTLTLSVANDLNKTGEETYDMGIRLVGNKGHTLRGTDTTSGSYTLNCGEVYAVKGLSASGANGDSAKFYGVRSGQATINGDGTATISAVTGAQTVILSGKAHGVLEMRSFDVINNAFLFDDSDAAATDYDTDGVNYNSTTTGDNATAVGAGAEFHVIAYVRPTVTDNVWGDIGGWYVLVEAVTTTWDVPTVKFGGAVLQNVKGQFTADEAKAYSAYEYAYLINKDIMTQSEGALDFSIFALSGVNPATTTENVQLDYASRGASASNMNADNVVVGAVQDDSSQTTVHTLIDTSYKIS
ncbi:MAG: hypothetical protein AAB973_02530 [Patescibacteria group bacterium]